MADDKILANNSPENCELNDENEEGKESEDEIFEVERIIGKSKLKGNVIFKVRWKGYGPADDTWEPAENLDACQDLIEEYVNKQSEAAKKRAEDRRAKRALMDCPFSQTSTEEEPDTNSPYPPNFKNAFWKDLEAGRVNLFDNDMYSKVKKRNVPKVESSSNNSPTSSPEDPTKHKKKRTLSDPERKVIKLEDDDKSYSTSKVPSVSTSFKSKSVLSRKIDFNERPSSPEENQENFDCKSNDEFSAVPESSGSDSELLKPVLNLVIRKISDHSGESSDSTCNADSENPYPTVKYSVVQKCATDGSRDSSRASSECKDIVKMQVSGEPCFATDGCENLYKKAKKKKLHKHHKHKSKRDSKSKSKQHTTELDKKRKIAATSLTNLEACTSKGTSLKCPRVEPSSETVNQSENDGTGPCTDIRVKMETQTSDSCQKVDENLPELNHSIKVEVDVHIYHNEKTDHELDINANQEGLDSSQSLSQDLTSTDITTHHSIPSDSIDLNTHNNNNNKSSRSHDIIQAPNTSSAGSNVSNNNNNSDAKIVNSNLSDSIAPGSMSIHPFPSAIKTEFQRQDSETVDSGIASPASDKSLTISRTDMMQPLDDLFRQTVLPLLPDNDQTQQRGADHELDLDLDEVDWDLFDKDVKFDSITLTNSEFSHAVIMGDYELVKQSVTEGGKYDLEQPDNVGKTLLMCAVHSMYDDIAELLIDHGASIDAQTKTGVTALMIACQNGVISIVNRLLERGAKVNTQCDTGETALVIAAKRGHSQILWLLLECGANFNQLSAAGHTMLGDLGALQYTDTAGILASHISRVMSEFDRQVSTTLNNTANLLGPIFPAQVFNLCEAESFNVKFNYNMIPQTPGLGYFLFVGHAIFTSQGVRCRFYGPCDVQTATLNGHQLPPLTKEGNFVLAFSPLLPGKNVLSLNTFKVPEGKAKLIVCAYKAQLTGR